MTVSTTLSSVAYTGNGIATVFSGTFPMLAPGDLRVTVNGIASTYVIAGNVLAPGWTATLPVAPANGAAVILKRSTPLQQLTAYTPYGNYQAKQHESDFDYLMYIVQELQRDAVYGIGGPPVGAVAAVDVTFAPGGTLESTNVQAAIQELDSDISTRFHEVGANSVITRGNATLGMGTTTLGGAMYDQNGVAVAGWTTADGLVSAKVQSPNGEAFTRKDYVDAQIAANAQINTPALIPITAIAGNIANPFNTVDGVVLFATLVNNTAVVDGGYAQNDEYVLPITSSSLTNAGLNVWMSATQVGYTRNPTVQVQDKTTGAYAIITVANWRLKLRLVKL